MEGALTISHQFTSTDFSDMEIQKDDEIEKEIEDTLLEEDN